MDYKFISEIKIDWNSIPSDSYLRGIDALNGLESWRFQAPITFFVGENGTGKSTLLEAIAAAYGFNPEGGGKNFNFSTKDTHSKLHMGIRIHKGIRLPEDGYFLRAESFYNVASQIEEYSDGDPRFYDNYGGKSLHHCSHGESFLALVHSRFRANGLYLLDEPEAALSPQRQLTLLLSIHQLAERGCQFLIATHSPILTGEPDAEILSFDDGRIHPVTYEETDSYQITEMFINNREYMLKRLFS